MICTCTLTTRCAAFHEIDLGQLLHPELIAARSKGAAVAAWRQHAPDGTPVAEVLSFIDGRRMTRTLWPIPYPPGEPCGNLGHFAWCRCEAPEPGRCGDAEYARIKARNDELRARAAVATR